MEMKNHDKILELQEVSFVYNGEKSPVWQGLNCFFRKDTLNLLLGPSGCGKSTLLYLLNGIIPHLIEGELRGNVLLFGERINEKEPKEMANSISMVFQDPEAQFCTFTVEDEIAFGLENQNIPPSEMEDLIEKSLHMVGMDAYKKSRLDELSGGQKQKIAVASQLAMQTDILIMDEPTANLDAKSRMEIFHLLKKLVNEYNKTIILVEHNLDGLIEMVEHAVVLNEKGEVSLCGTGNEVFRSLIWDEKFWNTSIYLPEELLIVREWVRMNYQYLSVKEYCKHQLKVDTISNKNAFHFEMESLKNLYQIKQEENKEFDRNDKNTRPLISMEKLSFSYKEKPKRKRRLCLEDTNTSILKDMNLSIQKGDFLAVVGPNGVGKSTLLSIVFKVLPHYNGKILVNQEDLKRVNKKTLYDSFGLVFQNPEVQFVTNDVYSELMFSLKKTKLTLEEKEKKVEEMLARFHLADCKEKSPFVLSQGQKRRLSVATMLLTGQEVLFLDEPTYGQDYENQISLMNLLKELNQEGVTIVMITHDMSTVVEYANKVALLLDGKVAFEGCAEELFKDTTLVEKGSLQLPGAYKFSKKLSKQFPDFPVCFTKEECITSLNNRTKRE